MEEEAQPTDDRALDDDAGPAFRFETIPAIAFNLITLLLLGIPLSFRDWGLFLAIPAAMNLAVALAHDGNYRKIERWLCTLAVPGNILLLLIAALWIGDMHDLWMKSLCIMMAAGALTTLWQTIKCWRHHRQQISAARPPRKTSKWLKVILAALAVPAALLTVMIYTSDPLDFCSCQSAKYAATAPNREVKALKNAYVSLLTIPIGIETIFPGEQRTAETLRLLNFSLPGDAAYQPKDKFAVFPMVKDDRIEAGSYVPMKDLRMVTGLDHPRLLFNLRRHHDPETGASAVALFAIIPDVKFCDGTSGYRAKKNFSIAKDNHAIVDDPDDFAWPEKFHEATCAQTSDGRNYYFQILNVWGVTP